MQKYNYKDDTDFRIKVKKLAALTFIPVADVIPAFESLSTQFLQDELPLLACIQDTLSSRAALGLPLGRVRRASKGILHTISWLTLRKHGLEHPLEQHDA